MNVFASQDYKEFLKMKAGEARGNLTNLAKMAKCQASYLLRVIREDAHLTPDQAYRLCRHWGFEAKERDYFLTLVNYARSADPEFRTFLKSEIERAVAENNKLDRVVERKEVSDVQALLEYHSDWRIALVHFLTACGEFKTLKPLSERAGVSAAELEEILRLLEERRLVQSQGKNYQFVSGSAHIPRGSPVLPVFLANWRQLAVQKSLKPKTQSVHFTNLQTIGRQDLQKLLETAKRFIADSKKICDLSASEDVVVVNLDVFVP